jgi:hypothetical protein
MMRIQTPASDSRHSVSAAPGIAGIVRKMRCSSTAALWCSANAAGDSRHSEKSQLRSSGSVSGSAPVRSATTARSAPV